MKWIPITKEEDCPEKDSSEEYPKQYILRCKNDGGRGDYEVFKVTADEMWLTALGFDYFEYLDEQDEGWVPWHGDNFPIDTPIIIEHKYGYDAVRFLGMWRYWYSNEPVHEPIISNILRTAKRYVIGNHYRNHPPPKIKSVNPPIKEYMKIFRGLLILFASFVFALIETKYFGSNWWPESIAECICDGIALIGSITGTVITLKDINKLFHP